MKNFKFFKSGFCEKLKLLLIPIGLLIGSVTMQAWSTEYKRIYFDKSRWNGDNATIWARAFKSADNSQKFDYKFVNVYSGDIMYLDVDTQYDKIVFVRNNASATAISWSGDAFWGKTGDLTIADGNLYILSDYKDAYSNGWWTTTMPIRGGTMYLDNSYLNWTPAGTQAERKDNIQFFHGNNSYDYTYVETDMANITNTLLYYTNVGGPSIASYVRFAKAQYTSGGFKDNNVPTYATGTYCSEGYTFSSGDLYIFTTNADGSTITPHYQDGGYTAMNKTITLAAKVKAVGSGSYEAGTSKGQLGASSYTFSAYNTCSTSSGSASVVAVGGTSGTFSAGYTANTTLTVSRVNGNYTFRGWYDADGNKLSDNTTYEGYRPKSTTTVYAYFEEKTYNVTAVASPTAGGSVTPTSATAFGRATGGNITATYNEGYYFTGWTGGTGTYGDASEANTTFTPSADNQTVTANFGYTWCVKGDFPNEESFSVEHLLEHVGKNASDKDTCYLEITLPANTTFDFKIFARDHSTWWSCSTHEAKTVYTYTSHGPHTCFNDNDNKNMTITTAGAGTYKFAWNITDRLLTIYYPTSYTVTFGYGDHGSSVTASGSGSGAITSGKYVASGENVTFTETHDTGYNLKGWYTASSGGTAVSTMSSSDNILNSIAANANVYAQYVPKTNTINLDANGGSGSPLSVTATYDSSDFSETVTSPEKSNYLFAGWYNDEDGSGNGSGTQVIDATGALIADVDGYTDEDGNWNNTTEEVIALHAKWISMASLETTCWVSDGNGGYTWNCDDIAGFDTPKPSATTWSTATNWGNGSLPTLATKVVLTHNMTIDDTHAKAKEVILNGVKLTIDPNKGLEVAGTITKADGSAPTASDLILGSSSAGNATLIFNNSNSAAATVQMYSKSVIADKNTWNWQYIGSPYVSASALHNYYGCYLKKWGEPAVGWNDVANGASVEPWKAYSVTQESTSTFVMEGTLVPTDNIVELDIPDKPSWIVANSWTAPIYIAAMGEAFDEGTEKVVYLFNTGFAPNGAGTATEETEESRYAAGTYLTVPVNSAVSMGNPFISSMQGFVVKNTPRKAIKLTLNYSTMVRPTIDRGIAGGKMHAPKNIQEDEQPTVLKMLARGTNYDDCLYLLERADFTTGFDNGWDGSKLGDNAVAPRLYTTREDGTKESVSAVPELEGSILTFRAGEDNVYTFQFEYSEEAETLYLLDLDKNIYTRVLTGSTYTFTTNDKAEHPRFILTRYGAPQITTGVDEVYNANSARKQMINGTLYIIRDGRIYNAEGTLVK